MPHSLPASEPVPVPICARRGRSIHEPCGATCTGDPRTVRHAACTGDPRATTRHSHWHRRPHVRATMCYVHRRTTRATTTCYAHAPPFLVRDLYSLLFLITYISLVNPSRPPRALPGAMRRAARAGNPRAPRPTTCYAHRQPTRAQRATRTGNPRAPQRTTRIGDPHAPQCALDCVSRILLSLTFLC
jgi:hypothetical protein